MQLTTADYLKTKKSLQAIRMEQDEIRMTEGGFQWLLKVIAFVSEEILIIMFDKNGKPKSKFQLVLSIPAIIRFAKKLLELINERKETKAVNRIKANK